MCEAAEFTTQREDMVRRYRHGGYIKTQEMAEAMLRVPREEFMDTNLRIYSYYDRPFPIPGDGKKTISAPYMYPVSYEPLNLREGLKILEVGAGSGYGAALAREMVGDKGLVVALEINKKTYEFAKNNLERMGYNDILLVLGDGSMGYDEKAPYDAISVTASTPRIPPPLVEQLKQPGRLVAPVGDDFYTGQDFILLEKDGSGKISKRSLMKVVYVPLMGKYGWRGWN
jgi:protein-L-isoaspartate(D-aspartate) O-methyltransferase